MKLLFDENLSPRLVHSISDLFPGSRHVEDCGLPSEPDEQVWHFAHANDFTIVTKDSDFAEMSRLLGGARPICPPNTPTPPPVIIP